MNTLYLSRRNLITLLNKLDDPNSSRTIIKVDVGHQKYPISEPTKVTAVENDDYYTDREPGKVHPAHEPQENDGPWAKDWEKRIPMSQLDPNGSEYELRKLKEAFDLLSKLFLKIRNERDSLREQQINEDQLLETFKHLGDPYHSLTCLKNMRSSSVPKEAAELHAERIRIALDRLPIPENRWYLIDSAPKDGRWISVTWTNAAGERFSERAQWSRLHEAWVFGGNVTVNPDGWMP